LQQNLKKTQQIPLIPINLVMIDNRNLFLFNIIMNSLPLSVPKINYLVDEFAMISVSDSYISVHWIIK